MDGFAAAIDRDAEVPIGLQLGWALCARIHDGEFRPGQRLPGLREMAEASGLNVNTVRAVYQRLEQKGLLESQQGSGTFVAATLRARRPWARSRPTRPARPRRSGSTHAMSRPRLYVAMRHGRSGRAGDRLDGERTAQRRGAVAHRRALRAQIATLERAIGEIEAEHPGVAPRPTRNPPVPGPTLLGAEELEQVRSTLVRRLAAVQSGDRRARSRGAQPAAQGPVPTAADPAPAKMRTTVALATP